MSKYRPYHWGLKKDDSCPCGGDCVCGEPEDQSKCGYCSGTGQKTDDSYSRFACPFCGGTGKAK